jgi:hypothetical protein
MGAVFAHACCEVIFIASYRPLQTGTFPGAIKISFEYHFKFGAAGRLLCL